MEVQIGRCLKAIKEEQFKYLIDKKKEYKISINGKDFAVYETELEATNEFSNIKNAIEENNTIYFS